MPGPGPEPGAGHKPSLGVHPKRMAKARARARTHMETSYNINTKSKMGKLLPKSSHAHLLYSGLYTECTCTWQDVRKHTHTHTHTRMQTSHARTLSSHNAGLFRGSRRRVEALPSSQGAPPLGHKCQRSQGGLSGSYPSSDMYGASDSLDSGSCGSSSRRCISRTRMAFTVGTIGKHICVQTHVLQRCFYKRILGLMKKMPNIFYMLVFYLICD